MRLLTLGLLLCASGFSQDYNRFSVFVDAGGAIPQADLRSYFNARPFIGGGFGYRFHEFFQVEGGYDTVFGAAGIRDFLPTGFGDLRIRDYQTFIPMGGRVILPAWNDRVRVWGGGGGAYIRYSERVRQPGDDFRIDCSVCTSRDGWGYYAQVGADVAFDPGRHFRLGVGGKVYVGETDGEPLGAAPARRTKDRWSNVFIRFAAEF